MLITNLLPMVIHPKDGPAYEVEVDVKRVGLSRNASRDVEATQTYLDGVRRTGYEIHGLAGICFKSRHLLTNEETIEVQGPHTSGEVEFVAFSYGGETFVSVGSDHNDRSLGELWTPMLGKVNDTAKTKQMVPAVVAGDAWRYDDVNGHWDDLVLKSYVTVSDQRAPFQELGLVNLLDLEYYKEHAPWLERDGSVLFGGSGGLHPDVPSTVYTGQADLEGVTFQTDFHFEMVDPVLGRTISHGYDVLCLEEPDSLSL